MSSVAQLLRVALFVVAIVASAAPVQFDAPGRSHRTDVDYDGHVVFVRLRWQSDLGFAGRGFRSAWNHDFDAAAASRFCCPGARPLS